MKRFLVNVYAVTAILCFLVMALPTFAYGQLKIPPLNVNVQNTPSVKVTTLPPVNIAGTVPVTGPAREIINFLFPTISGGKETITFTYPATVETVFAFCNPGSNEPYYLLLNGYASTSTTATVSGGATINTSMQAYLLGPVPFPESTAAFALNVPVGMQLDVVWSAATSTPGSYDCNVEVVFHY